MLLDAHCHIDLFDDPVATAKSFQKAGMHCVMATLLPSHYQASLPHLRPFHLVHPALGLHPLRVKEGKQEIDCFLRLAEKAEYIGEIGLDFSAEGKTSKKSQMDVLGTILNALKPGKFITVHSRKAHDELIGLLEVHKIGPVCFHFFTGGASTAAEIASRGHYFSINERMLKGRHGTILEKIPRDRILVESDGPYLTKQPLSTISRLYDDLSGVWGMSRSELEELLLANFMNCRTANLFY